MVKARHECSLRIVLVVVACMVVAVVAPGGREVSAWSTPIKCSYILCRPAVGLAVARVDFPGVPNGPRELVIERILRTVPDDPTFVVGARVKDLGIHHDGGSPRLVYRGPASPWDLEVVGTIDDKGVARCDGPSPPGGTQEGRCLGTPGLTADQIARINGNDQCESMADSAGYGHCVALQSCGCLSLAPGLPHLSSAAWVVGLIAMVWIGARRRRGFR